MPRVDSDDTATPANVASNVGVEVKALAYAAFTQTEFRKDCVRKPKHVRERRRLTADY